MTAKYPTVTAHLSTVTADRYNVYRTVSDALYCSGRPGAADQWGQAANATRSYDDIAALAAAWVTVA